MKRLLERLPRGRFAGGVVWSFTATAATQGFSLVAAIVTARLLGTVGFGEFGIVNGTIGSWGVLAGLGLGLTATKHVAEYRGSDPAKAARILGLSLRATAISGALVSALVVLFAQPLATHALNAPHLALDLRIAAPTLFLNGLVGTQNGALSGFEAFRVLSKVNVVRGLVTFAATVVGVVFFGRTGAISGTVLGMLAGTIAGQVALGRVARENGFPPPGRATPDDYRILRDFTLPSFLSGLTVGPAMWAANAILVAQPGGYVEMGLVNATSHWRQALLLLPGIFQSVALPMLSSSGGEGDARSNWMRVVSTTHGLTVLAIFPAGVALMCLADPLMALYGDGFAAGTSVAVATFAVVLVQGVGAAAGPAIQARGRMWFGFWLNVTFGAVLVATAWWTAARFGALSIPLAMGAGYVAMTLWGIAWAREDLPPQFLARAAAALVWALGVPFLVASLGFTGRLVALVPLTLATAAVALFVFADSTFQQLVRVRLGRLRKAPAGDSGARAPLTSD